METELSLTGKLKAIKVVSLWRGLLFFFLSDDRAGVGAKPIKMMIFNKNVQ